MTKTIIRDPRAVKIQRALISVSDKQGVTDLSSTLSKAGVEILSTGGTASTLKKAGIPVIDIADHTGFPEIMEGRVKTLHPKVHGGLLAKRDDAGHKAAMDAHGIAGIDLLVVNLYPFIETIKTTDDFASCIEQIDIGGPAMIRAAAKNHAYVTVVTDPADYEAVLEDLKNNDGCVTYALRKRLAATAFALTSSYDSSIAGWFLSQADRQLEGEFPRRISVSGTLKQVLRYGENPHQKAALYISETEERPGAATAKKIQGKELSYNNINDTNAAFELVAEFSEPAVAIIKHANPCGVAQSEDILEAYEHALKCDPVSAFGGIIALNRPLTEDLAKAITKRFVEVIIAPSIEGKALDALKNKDKIRVLTTGAMPDPLKGGLQVVRVAGGFLAQDVDAAALLESDLKVVTDRAPTADEMRDLIFAFKVAKHVKSNAIVYARNGATVGIGAGQMSRIDSSRIAAWKAQEAATEAGEEISLAKGSVVASDAFFPFADGLIAAAEAGVTAVIQPGGSIRDEEVIAAANERGLAMVMTGMRHFRH